MHGSFDTQVLRDPWPAAPEPRRHDEQQAAWRWRYCDPRSGEQVDPSEPMTPTEVLALYPTAELIPGTRVLLPAPRHPRWR